MPTDGIRGTTTVSEIKTMNWEINTLNGINIQFGAIFVLKFSGNSSLIRGERRER